jgi:CheY-like chemotaxis protein
MGGECGVSSLLGSGSAFWFTIRVGAIADAGPPAPAIGFEDVASTVLVVDDNATQRGLLGDHLQDIGMTVSAATSGPAAIEALRAAAERGSPFDVAFIDESMPGMDGFGVRNAVLAEPALATRMVLMTGMRLQSPAGILTDPGFCAVLPKPARLEDLRSCLGVALRLVPPLSTAEANGHALKAAGTALPETGRLLLAEDNPINQLVAVAMLSSAGYRVDTVLDGTAAVEAAGARSYDAILMDCQMPEMNGYEATAAIRALEGADRHTPIIALTAGARREDRERCLAEGMDAYLAKPVSKDALLALVALSVGSPEAADAVPLPAEAPAAAL